MSPNDWPSEPEDDEFYDEPPDDESLEMLPCPECGVEIYEEAEQCPHCGTYVVHESNFWQGRSTWWIVLGLLGIFAVILASFF